MIRNKASTHRLGLALHEGPHRHLLSGMALALCLLIPTVLWAGTRSRAPRARGLAPRVKAVAFQSRSVAPQIQTVAAQPQTVASPPQEAELSPPAGLQESLPPQPLAQPELSPVEDEPLTGKEGLAVPPPTEIPPVDQGTLSLSLRESLALALDNNLDIAIARYEPQAAETQIAEEKADFHPIANFSIDKSRDTRPQPSRFRFFGRGVSSRIFEEKGMEWGLRQKFVTGTEYEFKVNLDEQVDNPFSRRTFNLKSNSKPKRTDCQETGFDAKTGKKIFQCFGGLIPEYPGDISLIFRQHLLRDLGYDVNRKEILVAQNRKEMSKNDFRDRVEGIVEEVERTYWDLVFSIEDLKVKQQSLDLAKDLLERNKIQVRVGTMAPIEITEAQAQVAKREEEIIQAEKRVKDMEDQLRKLINLPDNPLTEEIQVIPLDKPSFEAQEISLNESIQQALESRPDYLRARLGLSNHHLEVKASKNRLLPLVDLTASYGNSSLEQGFVDSLSDLVDRNHNRWSFGLQVEIPLGNQAAKSRYTRARLEAEKTLAEIKNLEQEIILEVKESIRAVQSNLKRIEATRVTSQLYQERLAAEEKRFSVGLSTSRDVLEDQEQLAEARSREIQALIDYKKSLVDLEKKRGTILTKNKISLF